MIEPCNVVEIDKLFMPANKFAYSKYAEKLVLAYMCEQIRLSPERIVLTEGNVPAHDATINDVQFEVKFSSKMWMPIEYSNLEDYPTGVFISTAKYYLTVCPGYSLIDRKNHTYAMVGKVRLYKRADLIQYVLRNIRSCNIRSRNILTYAPTKYGKGSNCVALDPKKVENQWIGDIGMETNGRKTSFRFNS